MVKQLDGKRQTAGSLLAQRLHICNFDKHGKPIAEDDIIKMPIYGVGVVKRDNEKLYVVFLNSEFNGFGRNLFQVFKSEVAMEIVGNVRDKPELLKGIKL